MTSNKIVYDVAIVGGGLIGLATAHQLLQRERQLKLVVLEKETTLAAHQSKHNSGVIHSGVYYEPESFKAILCRRGYQKMVAFCNENKIQYNLCGKLIVATDEFELSALDQIYCHGKKNSLKGLELIDGDEITKRESNIRGIKALYIPETGVVNYRKVALKLGALIESNEGEIKTSFKVSKIKNSSKLLEIKSDKSAIRSKYLINCSGLYSDHVAKMSGAQIQHKIIPFRGEYFDVQTNEKTNINTLIYPVPNPKYPFLGVHFTKSIYGKIEAGPNAVLAHSREGYRDNKVKLSELKETLAYHGFRRFARLHFKYGVKEWFNSKSKNRYIKRAQKMMPGISAKHLTKGRSGIRAQACDQTGNLIQDFLFIHQENALHVCNAPSPGATSSLAIAEQIVKESKLIKH